MKSITQILDRYECIYSVDTDIAGQLNIRPLGPGMPLAVYGSFAKDSIENARLYSVQFDGFVEDSSDEQNEERVYAIICAVLNGDYKYQIRKKTLLDKVKGGSVYLTIGARGELIKDYYCVEQSSMKKRLKNGSLENSPYTKKAI